MEEKRASSALPLDIEEKKTASSAFPPIYAVGWAKAGTTVMAAALAAGMGVEASLEAANTCCCGNRECDLLTVPSCTPGGMQEASIMAPLFGGAASYYEQCPSLLTARVAKADDMLWQVQGLMDYTVALPPGILGHATRYIFFVRHPLYNIRSLLSWCVSALSGAEVDASSSASASNVSTAESCAQMVERSRPKSNKTLFYRIFAHPSDGKIAADALSLAAVWNAAANQYLKMPHRFASLLRYEDFLSAPVEQIARVRDDVQRATVAAAAAGAAAGGGGGGGGVGSLPAAAEEDPPRESPLPLLDAPAIEAAMAPPYTYRATYEHGDAASLFDGPTKDAIVESCAAGMWAFGYVRDGVAPGVPPAIALRA